MELEKETALVETILFLESEPVSEKAISNAAELSEEVVRMCLENLKEKYCAENSGIELGMITGGWCLMPKKRILECSTGTLRRKKQGQTFPLGDGNAFNYRLFTANNARRNRSHTRRERG